MRIVIHPCIYISITKVQYDTLDLATHARCFCFQMPFCTAAGKAGRRFRSAHAYARTLLQFYCTYVQMIIPGCTAFVCRHVNPLTSESRSAESVRATVFTALNSGPEPDQSFFFLKMERNGNLLYSRREKGKRNGFMQCIKLFIEPVPLSYTDGYPLEG